MNKLGNWIVLNNSNYSPFDGSDPHKYVCNRCGYVDSRARRRCEGCDSLMRLDGKIIPCKNEKML